MAEGERLLESPSSYPLDVLDSQYHDGISEQPDFRRQEGRMIPGIRKLRALYRWAQGPRPPRTFKIRPLLPQVAHLDLLHKVFPRWRHKVCLLLTFYLLWLVVFTLTLSTSLSRCRIPGYGAPVRLSCVARFWPKSTFCGVDGAVCRPFQNQTFAFRCPADCQSVMISTPETIGDQEYNYRTIVVGGSTTAGDSSLPIYRGDSFICASAIHAGIFWNRDGGSGVVSKVGEHSNFSSIDANGISSLNFTPSFPSSFTFLEDARGDTSQCTDIRWTLLIITVIFTVTLSIFTNSPSVFFGSTAVGIYFYVALASDPPDFENYMSVISQAFRGFLPAAFVGFVVYHFCIRYSLDGLNAPIEKTVLWLGGCLLGSLSNLTFEKLPIQRLTLHDFQQPGAVFTVVILVLGILVIAIFQAWAFRIEGRIPRYLAFYASIGLLLLALMAVPHMNVRIHHYILALILLPGTTLQTRPSLLYQGLLVGLFISGVARWGFDSILQTPVELFGDDFDTPIPRIATPVINASSNSISFSWGNLHDNFDSMSVLVNDVEHFRGSEIHPEDYFTWTRYKEEEPEYFRFAYVKSGKFGGSTVGKFTKPGTWNTDGNWVFPEPEADG